MHHDSTPNSICQRCGAAFRVKPSKVGTAKYCSWECRVQGMTNRDQIPAPNPSGLCMCGCGETTSISTRTSKSEGLVIGEHVRYINGHGKRLARRVRPECYDVDPETGCWNWNMSTYPSGYGCVGYQGRLHPAHRVSWMESRGEIPEGLFLDHLCRNKRCVNPDHLEPVTNAENIRRGKGTKLSEQDVRDILDLREGGMPLKQIAARYGVHWRHISNILGGWAWKDVTHR